MIRRMFGSTSRVSVTENPNWFVSLWKTDNAGTSASNQVQLPITLGSNPNLEVDWGDGNTNFNNTIHTYSTSGIFQITVKQHGYNDWRFGDIGDKLKLLEIKQWGRIYFADDTSNNMRGCNNMISTSTDLPDVSHKRNFFGLFRGCLLFNQNIEGMNTSAGTNFQEFLTFCSSYNQPLGLLPIHNSVNFNNFGMGITLSPSNYDATLLGWSSQNLKTNLTMHMGSSKYTSTGQAAKNQIILNYNWTFIDGGLI